MSIANPALSNYIFLAGMYRDGYFPNVLVDKLKEILVALCSALEESPPASIDDLYALSHRATEQINAMALEFEEHESEIETVAREVIASDFRAIAQAYGFPNADPEELIAPRDW